MDPRISVRNGKISDDTKDHITQVCTKLDKVERWLEVRLRKYHDKRLEHR